MLLWCLPVLALLAGLYGQKYRLALWIPALLVMGGGCLVNAARCGRLHCYITGPFLTLAAVYTALSGFHLVRMHPAILLDLILAVAVLACLAELPLGRYRKKAEK